MYQARPIASVILPHRDDLSGLGHCLDALEKQTVSREAFEIIVADNGSRCGLEAVRGVAAGRAHLVSVPEAGAGPARNGGVAESRGEMLAFVDSDCLPAPDWLAAGLAALEAADMAGGAMHVLVTPGAQMNGAEAFELVFAFDNRTYVERKHFSVTANLFVRRADFERVGPFRTGVSEDQDWCLRAHALGLRLAYAPGAAVGHPARRDWEALLAKWRRIMAEQYALTRARPLGRLRWLARTWLLPPSILPHGLRLLASPRLAGSGARLRGLAVLARLRLWRFVEAHRLLLKSPVDKPAA